MGQLEKYGLYVMCLVIFLILGVTLWGEPANATRTAGREQAAMQAGGSVPQDASFQRTPSRPSDLDELLGPPAQQPLRYQRGESSSRQAGLQQAEGQSSSLDDVLKEKVEPFAKPEAKDEPVTRPAAALSTVRRTYTVKEGDVLSKIAPRFDVIVNFLAEIFVPSIAEAFNLVNLKLFTFPVVRSDRYGPPAGLPFVTENKWVNRLEWQAAILAGRRFSYFKTVNRLRSELGLPPTRDMLGDNSRCDHMMIGLYEELLKTHAPARE